MQHQMGEHLGPPSSQDMKNGKVPTAEEMDVLKSEILQILQEIEVISKPLPRMILDKLQLRYAESELPSWFGVVRVLKSLDPEKEMGCSFSDFPSSLKRSQRLQNHMDLIPPPPAPPGMSSSSSTGVNFAGQLSEEDRAKIKVILDDALMEHGGDLSLPDASMNVQLRLAREIPIDQVAYMLNQSMSSFNPNKSMQKSRDQAGSMGANGKKNNVTKLERPQYIEKFFAKEGDNQMFQLRKKLELTPQARMMLFTEYQQLLIANKMGDNRYRVDDLAFHYGVTPRSVQRMARAMSKATVDGSSGSMPPMPPPPMMAHDVDNTLEDADAEGGDKNSPLRKRNQIATVPYSSSIPPAPSMPAPSSSSSGMYPQPETLPPGFNPKNPLTGRTGRFKHPKREELSKLVLDIVKTETPAGSRLPVRAIAEILKKKYNDDSGTTLITRVVRDLDRAGQFGLNYRSSRLERKKRTASNGKKKRRRKDGEEGDSGDDEEEDDDDGNDDDDGAAAAAAVAMTMGDPDVLNAGVGGDEFARNKTAREIFLQQPELFAGKSEQDVKSMLKANYGIDVSLSEVKDWRAGSKKKKKTTEAMVAAMAAKVHDDAELVTL